MKYIKEVKDASPMPSYLIVERKGSPYVISLCVNGSLHLASFYKQGPKGAVEIDLTRLIDQAVQKLKRGK